jgi:hypothetical protein
MKTTDILNLGALALALSCAACVETDDQLATATSDLGLEPDDSSGSRFYWAAYQHEPYIYKGCPEPGPDPQPWAEAAELRVRKDVRTLQLELGTAVSLDIEPLSAPRGIELVPTKTGLDVNIAAAYDSFAPISFLVNNEKCSFKLEAELQFE